MKVRLLTKTVGAIGTEYEGKTIDEIITGIARISSSREINELFDEPHKLLRHCVSYGHWSVFTTCNLGFEITTSRAMGREILRHKSAEFQEFSQRYSSATEFEDVELREQAANNRQSSTEIINPVIYDEMYMRIDANNFVDLTIKGVNEAYQILLEKNIARECARMILPETTQTVIYMNGNIRTWITFFNQRLHQTAQKEIRLVAEAIKDIFIQECPIISKMLFNFEDAYDIHILDKVILEKFGVFDIIKDNKFKKIKK
ncbi:MAG TPA: FAD-dependent thymidylate synthase [Burkholderiales bacterium]|nr:FAD-dependent thymidylate synthase [Burkholderiales bacterium]